MKLFALIVSLLLACNAAQAQDWAKEKLDKSPRHLEWVKVKNGDRTLSCFIAYPEVKNKATAVLVIHEIFGMSDWIRSYCDQLAAKGFIAIAPDLLSGKPGEDSSKYKSVDEQRKAVSALPPEQVASDLKVAADYVRKLPATNQKLASAGFCWGGGKSFQFATNYPELKAALVYYGSPVEDAAELAKIKCPVYGFYGGNDARITSTVESQVKKMKDAKKEYFPQTYEGAGHGFMRTGEAPDATAENKKAYDEGWKRTVEILNKL